MLTRLKTAIPLIILVVLAFTLPGIYGVVAFYLLSGGMLTFGISEAFSMTSFKDDCTADKWVTILFSYALALLPATKLSPLLCEPLLLICYLLALCFLLLHRSPEQTPRFLTTLGIFLYLSWTLSFFAKTYFLSNGPLLLLYAIAVTKMCDVGAYIIGVGTAKRAKGNHKLALKFSPKKSWEGLAGGILFGAVTAILLAKTRLGCCFSWWEALVFGIVAAVIGLVGDLVESAMKRVAGLKDSGNLPGIGGVLDILDSLIPIAPLFYLLLLWKMS